MNINRDLGSFSILRPSDFHVHFRDREMMLAALRYHLRYQYALVMPNLSPDPIRSLDQAWAYRQRLRNVIDVHVEEKYGKSVDIVKAAPVKLLMTLQICSDDLRDDGNVDRMVKTVEGMDSQYDVVAVKFYPRMVTTNSELGLLENDYRCPGAYRIYEALAKRGILALFHGEHPSEEVCYTRKEHEFLNILSTIHDDVPDLKIVLEHITTADAVEFVRTRSSNMAATITVHHLDITGNDVLGYGKKSGGLARPHWHCKPFAKRPQDRNALIQAALGGDERFFLGSDSAPHQRDKKECAGCCAGVYSAPVIMESLIDVFERNGGTVENLERFASRNGPAHYGLPAPTDYAVFSREDNEVPEEIELGNVFSAIPFQSGSSPIVPYRAGETLSWYWKEEVESEGL